MLESFEAFAFNFNELFHILQQPHVFFDFFQFLLVHFFLFRTRFLAFKQFLYFAKFQALSAYLLFLTRLVLLPALLQLFLLLFDVSLVFKYSSDVDISFSCKHFDVHCLELAGMRFTGSNANFSNFVSDPPLISFFNFLCAT
ncbi:Hypothetical_protein [Hexamita inflata]|uniref:Hypothetical_protein n=1 Tax=Hexamita inflata TaxID=28002 RepID=A0AA86RFJ5_9EUKA|nr:Hypothetical protein HINF_LOCUS53800 [Hexamita inflata]